VWHLDAMDQHLVSLVDPASFEADQYRTLRHLVEQLDSTKRVIAVTSALPGDGKTLTTLNLAGALAHASQARILVWDLDLRTPSVGKRLGLRVQNPGAVDLIVDPGLTINDVVRRHPQFPIWVIPGGGPLLVPYEVLKSPRLGALLREAREQYDYVVVDTAPLAPVPDSRLIADRVDGFVMVVSAHRTPRKFLEDALNLMEPHQIIGIVFNRDDRRLYGYYGSYYGYGRRAKRGRKPHAVLTSAVVSQVTASRD
jgi:capsular exopolysaccharide synthesis family protein